jgi:hypothetical protein
VKPQVPSSELAALRRHWRRWTAVVAAQARSRRGAFALDREAYQALHQKLMVACRALGGATEGREREFYQRLEELARPWLTTWVLEQADRKLLCDLLARCRQAERELQPPSRPWPVLRWSVAGVALLGALAVVILLVWTADWIWFPGQAWVQGGWHAFWLMAWGTRDPPWWFVPSVLAILLAMVVVWRSGRSYTGR